MHDPIGATCAIDSAVSTSPEGTVINIDDQVIAAITPDSSGSSAWLSMVLDHHRQIEQAIVAVKNAQSIFGRKNAQKWLATILIGHLIAEESVIYPAMAQTDQESHASDLYVEQSAAKVQLAALDELNPMCQDYLDKLEKIRGRLVSHFAEEEGDYFLRLSKAADSAMDGKLARLYQREFDRYVGTDVQPALWRMS